MSFKPWVAQSILTSCPVLESVMNAVLRSVPPKAILVVRHRAFYKFYLLTIGEWMLISPVISVATHTFPSASTANESNMWYRPLREHDTGCSRRSRLAKIEGRPRLFRSVFCNVECALIEKALFRLDLPKGKSPPDHAAVGLA